MAFLDNSGDIILDAVLTDTGRMRLARGDGSFKIAKYAFGDDEINYGSYNSDNASGSAYYDLEILQTPVLEAFTNNTATMKSKLISLSNNNLLYLPVMVLNVGDNDNRYAISDSLANDAFPVLVDSDTLNSNVNGNNDSGGDTNFLNGLNPGNNGGGKTIRLTQGLNTNEIPATFAIDPELKETQYIVEIDNRLGAIVTTGGNPTNPAFIDDDNIASYYVSLGANANNNSAFVSNATPKPSDGTSTTSDPGSDVIEGPRGTKLQFKIKASINLRSSDFLFTQIGTSSTFNSVDIYYIDTIIRVTGATTGYKVDVPVRFVKKQ